MTEFSTHTSAASLKIESVLVYLWVKILGEHIFFFSFFFSCHHPKVQTEPCQVDFCY